MDCTIIFLYALGGMVTGGIIGLFVGAVLLAIGYQVFMDWVDEAETSTSTEPQNPDVTAQTAPAGD